MILSLPKKKMISSGVIATILLLLPSSCEAQQQLRGGSFGDMESRPNYGSPGGGSSGPIGNRPALAGVKFPTFGNGNSFGGGNFGSIGGGSFGGNYGGSFGSGSGGSSFYPGFGSGGSSSGSGECGEGGSEGPWPECIGVDGDECCAIINDCNSALECHVVPEGSAATMDYREDRVRVFVDGQNIVRDEPNRG